MKKSLKKQGALARDILMMVDIKPLKKMRKKYGNDISKDLLRKLGTNSSLSSNETVDDLSSLDASPAHKKT